MVTMRSCSGMKAESALSIVVFPEPVPPEMTRLTLETTAARRKPAAASLRLPMRIRSSMPKRSVWNLRIVITGRPTAIGESTMLTREPSGRRASTIGEDSSRRRPTGATMRSAMRRTWAASRKRAELT